MDLKLKPMNTKSTVHPILYGMAIFHGFANESGRVESPIVIDRLLSGKGKTVNDNEVDAFLSEDGLAVISAPNSEVFAIIQQG